MASSAHLARWGVPGPMRCTLGGRCLAQRENFRAQASSSPEASLAAGLAYSRLAATPPRALAQQPPLIRVAKAALRRPDARWEALTLIAIGDRRPRLRRRRKWRLPRSYYLAAKAVSVHSSLPGSSLACHRVCRSTTRPSARGGQRTALGRWFGGGQRCHPRSGLA